MIMAFVGMIPATNARSADKNPQDKRLMADKVEVYYFHNERRCATCVAVENESKKALEELYPEKMKSGDIIFVSVNIEEEQNKALAEKYNVESQTLLVVKGGKQENLTNTAFLYATTKPEKLKKAIGEAIEKL